VIRLAQPSELGEKQVCSKTDALRDAEYSINSSRPLCQYCMIFLKKFTQTQMAELLIPVSYGFRISLSFSRKPTMHSHQLITVSNFTPYFSKIYSSIILQSRLLSPTWTLVQRKVV
jgi:hypothetical protein